MLTAKSTYVIPSDWGFRGADGWESTIKKGRI